MYNILSLVSGGEPYMLTQEKLDEEYVDGPAAAKMLNVTSNQVRFLCSKGRLKGAMKLGTSGWLIPRESVLNYKPRKRGPKSPAWTPDEARKIISEALKSIKKGNTHDKQ